MRRLNKNALPEQMLHDAATDLWEGVMVIDVSHWSRSNEDNKRAVHILNDHRKRFFAGTQEIRIRTALGRQM